MWFSTSGIFFKYRPIPRKELGSGFLRSRSSRSSSSSMMSSSTMSFAERLHTPSTVAGAKVNKTEYETFKPNCETLTEYLFAPEYLSQPVKSCAYICIFTKSFFTIRFSISGALYTFTLSWCEKLLLFL